MSYRTNFIAPCYPARKLRSARAPFASPRVAPLFFAGDGVDSRRCIGHIEVERKLRALRLEQTQLQPGARHRNQWLGAEDIGNPGMTARSILRKAYDAERKNQLRGFDRGDFV
jgi:hypothetical protein